MRFSCAAAISFFRLDEKESRRNGVMENKTKMEKARFKSMQQLENKMMSKFESAAQRRAENLGLAPIIKTDSPGKKSAAESLCG